MNLDNNITIEQSYNQKQYKYTRDVYLRIKDEIKKLSLEQIACKPQRKLDKNLAPGTARSIDPYIARATSYRNKEALMYFNALFLHIKDKPLPEKFGYKKSFSEFKFNNFKLRHIQDSDINTSL